MIFLQTCPKCEGDISLQRDSEGTYWQCRRCGRIPARKADLDLASSLFSHIVAQ